MYRGDAMSLRAHGRGKASNTTLPEGQVADLAERWAEASAKEGPSWLAGVSPEARGEMLELLCERSNTLFRRDPAEAHRTAEAATALASLTPAEGINRRRINDQRALAWAMLANTHRLRDDHAAAEHAWVRVKQLLPTGTKTLLLSARLFDLEASLRRDQGRFREALRLLRRAQAQYARKGKPALKARLGVKAASTLYLAGAYGAALRETLASIPDLDLAGEPILALTAFHNLVTFLAEDGAVRMALVMMDDGIVLYRLSPNPIDTLRGLWLRGRLCAAIEETPVALACLERVKQEFVALKLPYEAALASLELAVLLLKEQRTAEVKALAEEMYPVFIAQQIPREASASLLLFVEAARREAATVAAVEQLLGELKGRLAPQGRAAVGKFLT